MAGIRPGEPGALGRGSFKSSSKQHRWLAFDVLAKQLARLEKVNSYGIALDEFVALDADTLE